MKVKEVKQRISGLENVYDNMIRIQECCLRKENAQACIKELENMAALDTTLRNLVSTTAKYIIDEKNRLESLIDNAEIRII